VSCELRLVTVHFHRYALESRARSIPAQMTSSVVSNSKELQSLWTPRDLTLRQLSRNVFEHVIANNVFGRAAELAFYFLFALFPLIFLMMTSFGLFVSHRVELESRLLSYFADFLPPAAFQLLAKEAAEIVGHASQGKLTFGVVSALWCISSCISSMISALNAALHVREGRSWFKLQGIALGLSLLISTLLLAALLMVLVGDRFVGWVGAGLRLRPIVVLVWKAIQWPAAIFFVTFSCSLIYYCGPDLKKRRRWHWFTPGAAVGALAWLVALLGFRMYLHFFNHYGVVYGSLGAVMILLIWLYVSGLACLIGAEINAELERSPGLSRSSGAT
jgi:membrane protein